MLKRQYCFAILHHYQNVFFVDADLGYKFDHQFFFD